MAIPSIEEIRAREERLLRAMRHSDLADLDALLADDLVFTNHLGGTMGKADDLEAHRTGWVRVESVSASDERIRLLDGAAVVTVRLEISGTFGGEPASGSFRFTRVWAPSATEAWQVVTAHSTIISPVAAAKPPTPEGGSPGRH